MDSSIIRVSLLSLFVALLAWGSVAGAGQFRVAGLQTTAGRIGASQNRTGYQLRLGIAPLRSGSSQLASKKFTLHIGPFDEVKTDRSAARCWALYE